MSEEFWRPYFFGTARRGDTIDIISNAFPLSVAIVNIRDYKLFHSDNLQVDRFSMYPKGPISLKTPIGKCWVIITSNNRIDSATTIVTFRSKTSILITSMRLSK